MKTILIIDDEDSLVVMCTLALESRGYRILSATSGDSGVALARQHLPDLILCDVHMPGVGGDDVLRILRDDPELFGKQIVLMTGNTRNISPRTGMEIGADDFLVKPFTESELVGCVEARLRRANLHRRVEEKVLGGLRATVGTTLPSEFINPIAVILSLVEILRDEVTVMNPEDIDDLLKDIGESGHRLHRTLKNYLLILDLQGSADHSVAAPALLSADESRIAIMTAVAEVLHRRGRSGDITVTVAEAGISATSAMLGSIVTELVDNACRFSRKGTPITVDLAATGVLTVEDKGRGMSPAEVDNIAAFSQFDRQRFAQQGLGLGLVLAQKLVARCGGRFGLQSEDGIGTRAQATFNIGIPSSHRPESGPVIAT